MLTRATNKLSETTCYQLVYLTGNKHHLNKPTIVCIPFNLIPELLSTSWQTQRVPEAPGDQVLIRFSVLESGMVAHTEGEEEGSGEGESERERGTIYVLFLGG